MNFRLPVILFGTVFVLGAVLLIMSFTGDDKPPTDVLTVDARPEFRLAVPTPDHFLPLLYLAGVAGATDETLDVLVDGYTFGSLSMTSYTLDAHCPTHPDVVAPAAAFPDPALFPPDETNS